MSQQLQQTRYDQLIRRAGGLIGGGSKVSSVIPELFPVLELENTTAELLALSGWRLAWQSNSNPPVVGQNDVSQIINPAGSGMIVSVTQVIIHVDTSTAVSAQISTTVFGTPVGGLFRDARFGVPRNTTAQTSSANNIAVGGGLRLEVTAGELFTIRDDNGIVVLTPGTNLDFGTANTNLRMTTNYFWRERVAEASELSFP